MNLYNPRALAWAIIELVLIVVHFFSPSFQALRGLYALFFFVLYLFVVWMFLRDFEEAFTPGDGDSTDVVDVATLSQCCSAPMQLRGKKLACAYCSCKHSVAPLTPHPHEEG